MSERTWNRRLVSITGPVGEHPGSFQRKEETINRQNSKRPTLAELWRTLLTFLEDQGVEDAPAKARSLAIVAWTGWNSGSEPRRIARVRRRPVGVR